MTPQHFFAAGLASLLIGIPSGIAIWAIGVPDWRPLNRLKRPAPPYVESLFSLSPAAGQRAKIWYFAVLGLGLTATSVSLLRGDYGSSLTARAIALLLVACAVIAAAPWRPILGPLAYVIVSYSLPREDAVTNAIMSSGVAPLLTLLSVASLAIHLSSRRPRPAPPSTAAIWALLAYSCWVGIVVLAAMCNGHPIGDGLVHRSSRIVQSIVLCLVAYYSKPSLRDIQTLIIAITVLLGVRAIRHTDNLRLEQNLAALVAITIPWVASLAFTLRKWWLRAGSIVAALGLTALIVVIANRGAFLGLAAGVLAIWCTARWKWRIVAATVPPMLFFFLLLPQTELGQRLDQAYGEGDFQESAAGRLELWSFGIDLARQYPVFGVGPENYSQYFNEYFDEQWGPSAHNIFVDAIAETGYLGFVLFAAIWGCATVSLAGAAARSMDVPLKCVYLAALASIWVYLVTGTFLSISSLVYIYIWLGLSMAFVADSTYLACAVTSAPPAKAVGIDGNVLQRRHWDLAALLYTILVILGSLSPFKFEPIGPTAAAERFLGLSWWPPGHFGRVDVLSNIALFVPMGFLVMASFTCDCRNRESRLTAIALTLIGCVGIGAIVEYLQCWFPNRTVSAQDVLAQLIGTILGISIWLLIGQNTVDGTRTWLSQRASLTGTQKGILFYVMALLLWSGWPLEITMHPMELWSKYKEGYILPYDFSDYLTPFRGGPSSAVARVLFSAPLGWFVSGAWLNRGERFRSWRCVIWISAGAAICLEILRLMNDGQMVTGDQIAMTFAGLVIGAQLQRIGRGHSDRLRLGHANAPQPVAKLDDGASTIREPLRRDSSIQAAIAQDRPQITLTITGVMLLVALTVAMVIGQIMPSIDRVPYNVRELFGSRGWLVGAGVWACLAVWGGVAWSMGIYSEKRPYQAAIIALPLIALVGAATFAVLQLFVPAESLDDILGTPVLDISPSLERGFRFSGLLAAPLLAWSMGIRLAGLRIGRNDLAPGVTWLLGCGASYAVVVRYACTDNLTELLRNGGLTWHIACLISWLVMTAWIAAVRFRMPQGAASVWRSICLGATLTTLSVVPAWWLVNAGLNDHVKKCEADFSALQFLLSPDRQHYLTGVSLFARFALLHGLVVIYLAACGCVYHSIVSARSRPETELKCERATW